MYWLSISEHAESIHIFAHFSSLLYSLSIIFSQPFFTESDLLLLLFFSFVCCCFCLLQNLKYKIVHWFSLRVLTGLFISRSYSIHFCSAFYSLNLIFFQLKLTKRERHRKKWTNREREREKRELYVFFYHRVIKTDRNINPVQVMMTTTKLDKLVAFT